MKWSSRVFTKILQTRRVMDFGGKASPSRSDPIINQIDYEQD